MRGEDVKYFWRSARNSPRPDPNMRRTPEEIYRIDRTGEGDGDAHSIPALDRRKLLAKDRDSGGILHGRRHPARGEGRASAEKDVRQCGASAAEERARARDATVSAVLNCCRERRIESADAGQRTQERNRRGSLLQLGAGDQGPQADCEGQRSAANRMSCATPERIGIAGQQLEPPVRIAPGISRRSSRDASKLRGPAIDTTAIGSSESAQKIGR